MPRVTDIREAVAGAGAPLAEPEEKPAVTEEKPGRATKPKPAPTEDENDEAGPLKKYRVELTHLPAREVEAFDRLDAIERYKTQMGVISTPHNFTVQRSKS
ncbi:hypothetical protein VT84_30670 [Gemmata sp. SH-PL17]|uniref:hypothetical protein n=1 Tax=Gemmata sp. SH-PL17 TaxID=1630693 RepID=UPI00078B58EA|nr:hypothetical protein [Gemmata sp. SH-PL17]AMV28797.1 hypothetical protein VT84_30670 [Gemmata sp. SH-PL17]